MVTIRRDVIFNLEIQWYSFQTGIVFFTSIFLNGYILLFYPNIHVNMRLRKSQGFLGCLTVLFLRFNRVTLRWQPRRVTILSLVGNSILQHYFWCRVLPNVTFVSMSQNWWRERDILLIIVLITRTVTWYRADDFWGTKNCSTCLVNIRYLRN